MCTTPTAAPHAGVQISRVEAGATGSGVQAVDLGAGEVRWPRSERGEAHGPTGRREHDRPRRRRLPNCDVKLAVVADLGLRLQELPAIKRDDVGVDLEGDDGGRGLRELFHDQNFGAPILEEEKEDGVPDDALEDDDLDHEAAGVLAVHGDQEGDAHHQGVGERGEGEDGDGPVYVAACREIGPEGEEGKDDGFLQGVGGDESQVHGVGVVSGDEVEGEQRHCKDGDEAVDAGALIRREDLPPPHRAVGQDHRHVQRHHRRQHRVQISPRDHLQLSPPSSLPNHLPKEEIEKEGDNTGHSGRERVTGGVERVLFVCLSIYIHIYM
uniref:Uncharacterized protein n=1 Tax=Nymphaea colorata TaxID=210225 RepID=A0A5K1G350_9MAGN